MKKPSVPNAKTTSSPIVIRRRHVATLGSVVGGGALMIAIVGLITVGALAPVVIAAFGIAIFGFALWGVMMPAEFIGFFTGRQVRFGTLAIFSSLLLTGIIALIYIQVARAAINVDATQTSLFTLSIESERVISRVSRPIHIIGFYSSQSLQQRAVDDQFFRLYETATNGLIQRSYIDPDEQPTMAQRFGVTADAQVFLVNTTIDGSLDFNTIAPVPSGGAQEREMTEAIARMLIAGSITVYFENSLGERSLVDETQEGLTGIYNGMQQVGGLVVKTLNLTEFAATNSSIPNDAAAFVFARPTRDLTGAEIAIVARYLDRGGSLLLLTDPLFNDNPFMQKEGAFNTYLWDTFGIRALDAAVVEGNAAVTGQSPLEIFSAFVYAESDIAQRLDPQSAPTLFSVARAIEVKLADTPPDIATGQVVLSSETSYGETNFTALGETNTYVYDPTEDIIGPMTTVGWATNINSGAKIVLIGDGDFISNGRLISRDGLALVPGNAYLFTDSMAWLTSLSEKIDFAPQFFGQGLPLIFVSEAQFAAIVFITAILMPTSVLMLGMIIWSRRNRR